MNEWFGTSANLFWWQECLRAVVIFIYGLIIIRILGRRVFAKWGALDTVVSIVVGSNLSRALTGTASMGGTLAATTLLMVAHWMLAQLAARSSRISSLVEGSPIELGRDGALDQKALVKDSVSGHDLEEAFRLSGVQHVGNTSRVVLEPSGKITIVRR